MQNLRPSKERAIYLFTTPPKVLKPDHHKTIQVQKVISDGKSSMRIRPILNLEWHRLWATRVVELEEDDVRICEFQPRRGPSNKTIEKHKDTPPPATSVRRSRTISGDMKPGAYGGKIVSTGKSPGDYNMAVVGSRDEGLFLFQSESGISLMWTRVDDPESGEHHWILDDPHPSSVTSPKRDPNTPLRDPMLPLISQEKSLVDGEDIAHRQVTRPGTHRAKTGDSVYTTEFANESQLSGMGETALDDSHVQFHQRVVSVPGMETDPNGTTDEGDRLGKRRGYLSAHPVPHLQLRIPHSDIDKDVKVGEVDVSVYPILISALWITHSSTALLATEFEDPQLRIPSRMPIDPNESPVIGTNDGETRRGSAASKKGGAKSSKAGSPETSGGSPASGGDKAKAQPKSRPSFFSRITRICGKPSPGS